MSERPAKPPIAQRFGAWRATARRNPLFWRGLALAAAVIVLDQLSKHWILYGVRLPTRLRIEISAIFDLSYVENTGISFGLFAGGLVSRIVLSVVAVVIAGFVTEWLGRLDRRVAAAGAGLVIGGALGNVYDRVIYGFVVDFLDFSGLGFPFVFNVADAAISVGAAVLLYDGLYLAPKPDAASADVTSSEPEPPFRRSEAAPKPPNDADAPRR